MKPHLVVLIALAACVSVVLASSKPRINIYKKTLQAHEARIAGGKDAKRYQFPYQAAILSNGTSRFHHVCGGVLIKKKWVLTAAHCLGQKFSTYRVKLGQLRQEEKHKDVQEFKVKKYIVHPKYPGGVAAYDVALIELKRSAKLTKAVKLAKLGSERQCRAIEKTIISGWGRTGPTAPTPTTLQWAKLPRISNEQCAKDLKALLGHTGPLDDTMICVKPNRGKKEASCNGDSGGPLVLASNKTLVGIVSWGVHPCGAKRAPTVFTNVCSHLDFIKKHVR